MSAVAMQSAPLSSRRKSCWLGTPEIYFRKTIDNSRLVKLRTHPINTFTKRCS